MSVASIAQNGEESKSNGQIAIDPDVLTHVQWDLMAITEHLQVVERLVAAMIEEPGASEEGVDPDSAERVNQAQFVARLRTL